MASTLQVGGGERGWGGAYNITSYRWLVSNQVVAILRFVLVNPKHRHTAVRIIVPEHAIWKFRLTQVDMMRKGLTIISLVQQAP
jgi:hypothetical protein